MNYSKERINLDWVRGLAALSVAALHCREISWVGIREFIAKKDSQNPMDIILAYLGAPIVWGSAGVAVFFVLSGYVIHISTANKLRENSQYKLNIKSFYTRRIVRVYAVFLPAITLTYILDSLSLKYFPIHEKLGTLSLSTLAGNLLATQGLLTRHYGSNGPLWTLAIEIQFYAAYPFLLIALRKYSAEKLLLFVSLISILSYILLKQYQLSFFTTYYISWLLGFYAAELKTRNQKILSKFKLSFLAITITLIGCASFFFDFYIAFLFWSIGFFFYLLIILASPPSNCYIIRFLTGIGTFSYTLYATHEPIAVFINAYVYHGVKSYSMLTFISYLLVTVLISYFMYLIFEKRSIKWLATHI